MARPGRRALIGAAAAVAFVALWQKLLPRPALPEFGPVRGAPGWSFATAGSVSGLEPGGFATIGLQRGPAPLEPGRLDSVVHRDAAGDGRIRLAVFSDYFCPFCRRLIAQIAARHRADAALAVTWHELPLLGPNSVLAAKALMAAGLQGAYAEYHARLVAEGFVPQARSLGEVAAMAGLDAGRLMAEMEGPRVAALLADSAAAAARLGFFGTPGLVAERRAVLGALDPERMDRLIAEAR